LGKISQTAPKKRDRKGKEANKRKVKPNEWTLKLFR